MDEFEAPSERQVAYARRLGIRVHRDMTRDDLSRLIDEAAPRVFPPSEGNLRSANELGITTEKPLTKKAFFDHIWRTLQQGNRSEDMAAFFAYRICRHFVSGERDHRAVTGVNAPVIREIARELASDEKIMKSIRRYDGRELIWFGTWTSPDGVQHSGASKRTMAYKAAAALIGDRVGLADPNLRAGTGRRRSTRAEEQGTGCLIVLAMLILLLLVL